MVLGLFHVLWRLEIEEERGRDLRKLLLFVAACAAVGLTGGYRVVTLVVLPVVFVWGVANLRPNWLRRVAAGMRAFFVVFALMLTPYFPDSLAVFGVRTASLSTQPTAASIWQWLPLVSVKVAGHSIGTGSRRRSRARSRAASRRARRFVGGPRMVPDAPALH